MDIKNPTTPGNGTGMFSNEKISKGENK